MDLLWQIEHVVYTHEVCATLQSLSLGIPRQFNAYNVLFTAIFTFEVH